MHTPYRVNKEVDKTPGYLALEYNWNRTEFSLSTGTGLSVIPRIDAIVDKRKPDAMILCLFMEACWQQRQATWSQRDSPHNLT